LIEIVQLGLDECWWLIDHAPGLDDEVTESREVNLSDDRSVMGDSVTQERKVP
jgi:hypothetical protein